jgi:hypothetical protein
MTMREKVAEAWRAEERRWLLYDPPGEVVFATAFQGTSDDCRVWIDARCADAAIAAVLEELAEPSEAVRIAGLQALCQYTHDLHERLGPPEDECDASVPPCRARSRAMPSGRRCSPSSAGS